MRYLIFFIAISMIWFNALPATAQVEGQTRFSSDEVQFYDGNEWVSTDQGDGDGGDFGDTDCVAAGQMIFDDADNRMEFCNSSLQVRHMNEGTNNGNCSTVPEDNGRLQFDFEGSNPGFLKFCDGTRRKNTGAPSGTAGCASTSENGCDMPSGNHNDTFTVCVGVGTCNYICNNGTWTDQGGSGCVQF